MTFREAGNRLWGAANRSGDRAGWRICCTAMWRSWRSEARAAQDEAARYTAPISRQTAPSRDYAALYLRL